MYRGGCIAINTNNLIPIKQASNIIGVAYKTLNKWVKENKISYTKLGGRYYLTQEQLKALVFIYNKN